MVSHGCIRHFPPDIRQIFANVSIGTPVVLTYQTVTIGRDGGVVYMAVFPDIYARGTNSPGTVRNRLASFGLNGVLTGPELEQRLAQADGIARPLLGSTTKVSVNLSSLNTPIGPTLKENAYYLPLRTLADALHADITWDSSSKTATVTRGSKRVTYPSNSGFTALDTLFVPVRRAVEGLGGRVLYSKGRIRILIL
jgi:hypothetical protein